MNASIDCRHYSDHLEWHRLSETGTWICEKCSVPPGHVRCDACRQIRQAEDAVAFWRVREPSDIRYVCRPGLEIPLSNGDVGIANCWGKVVRSVQIHGIAPATEVLGRLEGSRRGSEIPAARPQEQDDEERTAAPARRAARGGAAL